MIFTGLTEALRLKRPFSVLAVSEDRVSGCLKLMESTIKILLKRLAIKGAVSRLLSTFKQWEPPPN